MSDYSKDLKQYLQEAGCCQCCSETGRFTQEVLIHDKLCNTKQCLYAA